MEGYLVTEDLHTHTYYSHGTGSIEDNCLAAIDRGLKRIAITDHGPGHPFYGVRKADYPKMKRDIEDCSAKFRGRLEVLWGMEYNIIGLGGQTDIGEEDTAVRIAGYHRGASPATFGDFFRLYLPALFFSPKGTRKLNEKYSETAASVVRSGRFLILSHPGEYIPVNMELLSKAAAASGTLLEINNKHPMSPEDIAVCAKNGAGLILSSDAHEPAKVGVFDRAWANIEKSGIDPCLIRNVVRR